MTDPEIIALLHQRNEQGLQALRSRYGRLCLSLAERMLGSREDAEECVSDMLLSVWESIPPQSPQSLEAYAVTLVRRSALDRIRRGKSRKRGGGQYAAALDELADVLPAGDSVEDTVQQRELTRALKAFLDALPPASRHIFMERYYFAYPLKAIADETGMHLSAVKMILSRTRKKLRTHLEKEGLL